MPNPIWRNYNNLIHNIDKQQKRYNIIMTRVLENWDGNFPFVVNRVDSESINILIKSIFVNYKDLLKIYCKKLNDGVDSELRLRNNIFGAYEFLESHNNDLSVFTEQYRIDPLFDPADLLSDPDLLSECANN